jgi:hypothetical protein
VFHSSRVEGHAIRAYHSASGGLAIHRGCCLRSAQTTLMLDVVYAVMTARQPIENRADYDILNSQFITGTRTLIHFLPKFHML